MDIYIDYPKDKNQFFISVSIGDGRDAVSFDWTVKGHRIILQRYKEERGAPEGKPNGEWDTVHISDGKFMGREHVVWYDLDKEDWVNGRIWETIKEWLLPTEAAESLKKRVDIVCNDLGQIENHQGEIKELERELRNLIESLRLEKEI